LHNFDEKALLWDHDSKRVDLAKAVALAIKKNIPLSPTWNALEYGAGTGLVGSFLHSHFKSLLMVDQSSQMVETACQKIKELSWNNVSALCLDITQGQKISQTFDFIFSSMVFHHIQDISQILEKFYNLLNKQGFLAIADLILEDGDFHSSSFLGHLGFDLNQFSLWVKQAGFKNVQHQIIYTMQKTTKQGVVKDFPIFLLWAQKS